MANVVHFDVHGPLGAPSVLLSSGLGGTAGFWQPQLSALINAGCRVITYDQRGTGRSAEDLSEPYSIQQMAIDALEILAAGAPKAYVAAQPIFLYPAAWCVANQLRVEDEVTHGLKHFQGESNLRIRISALRAFNIDSRLEEIKLPVLVSTALDDILVPWTCSERLAQALTFAELDKFDHGGHGHNVTEADRFNAGLLDFLGKHSIKRD
jgi:aminoacrylate hydrolase